MLNLFTGNFVIVKETLAYGSTRGLTVSSSGSIQVPSRRSRLISRGSTRRRILLILDVPHPMCRLTVWWYAPYQFLSVVKKAKYLAWAISVASNGLTWTRMAAFLLAVLMVSFFLLSMVSPHGSLLLQVTFLWVAPTAICSLSLTGSQRGFPGFQLLMWRRRCRLLRPRMVRPRRQTIRQARL